MSDATPGLVARYSPESLTPDGRLDTHALARRLGTQTPMAWQGDCLEYLRALPDSCVDLVVTSPPYNLRNTTGSGAKYGYAGGGHYHWNPTVGVTGYESHTDDMPHEEYVSWQRECLTEMLRIVPDTGAVFYIHKPRVQAGLWQDRHDILDGFPLRQVIIWRRAGGINFNPGYFLPTYEHVYLLAKPGFTLKPEAVRHGDVWEFLQDLHNDHPAPFPLGLARRCVAATDAHVVFDPFLGSGTTALAALAENREWAGCDLSNEYCHMADQRIQETLTGGVDPGQPSLLGGDW